MLGLCERCGTPGLRVGGRGRPQRYCSKACTQAAYRDRRLPAEMTALPRWLRWKAIPTSTGTRKVPITVTGTPASSTDHNTWSTYALANRSTRGEGLGFALGDGIGCIDLDDCYSPGGALADWAAEILDRCPPTFLEVSWSGRGVHIFGWLTPAKGVRRRDIGNVEVYSQGRYIAVTGNRLPRSVPRLGDLTGLARELTTYP